jgi:hypothetical protein
MSIISISVSTAKTSFENSRIFFHAASTNFCAEISTSKCVFDFRTKFAWIFEENANFHLIQLKSLQWPSHGKTNKAIIENNTKQKIGTKFRQFKSSLRLDTARYLFKHVEYRNNAIYCSTKCVHVN